jgi:hypothetical protein
MKKSLKMDLTSVDSCLNIPEKDECCICLDDFKNEEDALNCKICNYKICIKCFDRISHIARDKEMNKFAKTKCPCCRTLNIRDFNSLSKEHILYLLNASLDNTHILAKAITTISKTAENKKTIEWRKVRETLEPTKIIFGL